MFLIFLTFQKNLATDMSPKGLIECFCPLFLGVIFLFIFNFLVFCPFSGFCPFYCF